MMDSRHSAIVCGWVRNNCIKAVADDVVRVIFDFYSVQMDSDILDDNEQADFLDLLFDALKQETHVSSRMHMQTLLLHRASEHKFSSKAFHDRCDKKGPTIVVVRNEHNHVYGGYATVSWNLEFDEQADHSAFLFMIRPNLKLCRWKDATNHSGEAAICSDPSWGPVFGTGNSQTGDLWINDRCTNNGTNSMSFDFVSKEMCGGDKDRRIIYCDIKEYEVFQIGTP